MSDERLLWEVFPVIGGQQTEAHFVGAFEHELGVRRSIAKAHVLMRDHAEIDCVSVYNTDPERGQPRRLGVIRREARKIVRT